MSKKPVQPSEEISTLPIIKSLAIERAQGFWVVLEISTQGDRVISVTSSNPDMKAMAMETFRVKAGQLMTEDK